MLGALWREPRLDRDGTAGRPVPGWLRTWADAPAWRWAVRLVGLALFGYFGIGLLAGPDSAENPTAGAFYVLLWVGIAPASLLFGPVWRALNPLRTLHRLAAMALRRDPTVGLRPIPARMGLWPAAVGLFAFVWLELVAPERATLPVITAWLAVYLLAMAVGAVLYGSGWFERGDPFEVYSTLVGRLALIGRRADGVLVWRNPLDGIASVTAAPGLVPFVIVLLGSTMFDSLSNAPFWLRFVQEYGLPAPVTGTGGLVVVIGVVAAAYDGACVAAGRRAGIDAKAVPGQLAHSIVPIAVGYIIAHYYSLLVLEGQRTVTLAADPLGTGADWLGTRGLGDPVRLDHPDRYRAAADHRHRHRPPARHGPRPRPSPAPVPAQAGGRRAGTAAAAHGHLHRRRVAAAVRGLTCSRLRLARSARAIRPTALAGLCWCSRCAAGLPGVGPPG